MADLNKVFLMGRLTFDPELRRTPTGTAVTELRLATTRTWPGRDGERREETLFIDVTVWDRQAENCCQYLRKGSGIHVEGFLKMDTWDDKTTGEKRSKIRVHADRVQFLDWRRGDSVGAAAVLTTIMARRLRLLATRPRRRQSAGSTVEAGATASRGPAARTRNGPARPEPSLPVRRASSPVDADDREEDDIPF